MKKIILLQVALLLIFKGLCFSQFLHVGAKTFMTPNIYMSFFEYDETEYVYYFSNEYNETIRFSGLEESETKGFYPYPDIYVRYDLKNNLFFQLELFSTWFTNEAKYKNSVDYPEYNRVFNPYSDRLNLGYNTIKIKWAFLGNSLSAAYVFAKAKSLRPYVFGGFTTMYLVRLEQGEFYDDSRQLRNDIIFQNLSTFKKTTFYIHAGIGLKYKALALDFYYRNTIADVDIYANNYWEYEDLSLKERPNYDYFDSINISLSFNILSFNFSKDNLKEYKNKF